MTKRIGVLTGGGDCGGLNAIIESIVRSGINEGGEVHGIKKGWEGLVVDDVSLLTIPDVQNIHSLTGTILQTSRTNPFNYSGKLNDEELKNADISQYVIENIKKRELEAIIACGGDDTLGVIPRLIEAYGNSITFIGIPKSMDGDLQVYSLGLDTTLNRSRNVLEDFVPLLKANGSIGIVELFGRDVGRVAFKAGIAAGADVILIPEVPVDLDYLCDFIANKYDERAKRNNGETYILIAVAEGTKHPITGEMVYLDNGEDSFGHGKLGGIGEKTAKLIYDRLKNDPRIKAHSRKLDMKPQRPTYDIRGGGTSYSDSYIGQKLGAAAVQYLKNGAESGMAVTDFNERGQVEIMPISELIVPRRVHMEVLKLFERSGLYCFGRIPDGEVYLPDPVNMNIDKGLLG